MKSLLFIVLLLIASPLLAQTPCGAKNNSAANVPSDYTTMTPPAEGTSYVDSSYGCTVYRVTNGPVDYGSNVGACHTYIMSPVNSDDTLISTVTGDCSSIEVRAFPSGTILIPWNDPSLNGLNANNVNNVWEPGNAHKFLFLGGNSQGTATQLMTYNVYKTTATGTVNSASSSITVASATGIVANASITIQGAGTSGALYSGTVGAGYTTGTTIPISPNTSTTVTAPIVAIGYDTVQHDFTGTYTGLYAGSHGSIASSTCCIALIGHLASGIWQTFSYNYSTDTVNTAVSLNGTNPTGITVNATTGSGGTSIVLAKTASGNWSCNTVQHGLCQFTIAGDSTVYSINGGGTTITASTTSTVNFTPVLAQSETGGSAVTVYFKPNDPRIIGNSYVTTENTPNLSFDLYDINMNYLDTPNTQWGGNTPHSDVNIDPASGHPVLYSSAANDIGTDACTSNGVEKIDMITSTRTCLMQLSWFGDSQHFSTTANGLWLLLHETDAVQNSTGCLAPDLPGNYSSLWKYPMNEVDLINVDTGDIYRMAHHYSRMMTTAGCVNPYGYWPDPRVAVSYDGNWGIFDSNFDLTARVASYPDYVDVYAVQTNLAGGASTNATFGGTAISGGTSIH